MKTPTYLKALFIYSCFHFPIYAQDKIKNIQTKTSAIITKENISLDKYSEKDLIRALLERVNPSNPTKTAPSIKKTPRSPQFRSNNQLYQIPLENLRREIIDHRKYINGRNDLVSMRQLQLKTTQADFLKLTKANANLIPKATKQCKSVCCIIHNDEIVLNGNGYKIKTKPLGKRHT